MTGGGLAQKPFLEPDVNRLGHSQSQDDGGDNPSLNPMNTYSAIDPILEAYRAGQQTLLISGRSHFDLHLNEHGQLRPLRNTLMRRAREEFGMATLLFNLALGP